MENTLGYFSEGVVWKLMICIILFLIAILLPNLLFLKNENYKLKFASRTWWTQAAWFCMLLFVILLDGEFLKSGIVNTIAICAAVLAVFDMISNTVERILVKKGDFQISAELKKSKKENNKK